MIRISFYHQWRECFTLQLWSWLVPRLSPLALQQDESGCKDADNPLGASFLVTAGNIFGKGAFTGVAPRRAHVRLTVTVSPPVRSMYLLAHKFEKEVLR